MKTNLQFLFLGYALAGILSMSGCGLETQPPDELTPDAGATTPPNTPPPSAADGGACDDSTNFTNNPFHCGGCNRPCAFPNAVAACVNSQCVVASCQEGFKDDDLSANNGCEASCQRRNLSSSGKLDFDLPVIQLSGRVLLNGQPMPVASSRGSLVFELPNSRPVTFGLPSSGDARYQLKLFKGAYKVRFVRNSGCNDSAIPCGDFVVKVGQTPVEKYPLTSDGVLDFNVTSTTSTSLVTLNGRVTVNNATMPSSSSRGMVVFKHTTSSFEATDNFDSTGEARYSVRLVPGLYDVSVRNSECTEESPLPCYESVRQKALNVSKDGVFDFNLPVITISGQVKLNNGVLPGNSSVSSRGSVVFLESGGPTTTAALSSTGAGSYRLKLYPGTFSVQLSNTRGCDDGPLPCLTRQVQAPTVLSADGVLDFNVQTVRIEGAVTVNGASMGPAGTSGRTRGDLIFRQAAGEVGISFPLESSGAATYSALLYPGRYQLSVNNLQDCDKGPIPCGERLVTEREVSGNGVLDVDLPVARLVGVVTVNGQSMASESSSRGQLTFEGPTTSGAVLDNSGSADFSVTLYRGTYKVSFARAPATCTQTSVTPCQSRVLNAAMNVTADASANFDLPVVEVSGQVLLNGQAMGASPNGQSRGNILFQAAENTPVASALTASGNANYKVRVFPGNYNVLLENQTDVREDDSQPLPVTGPALLRENVQVTSTASLDVDAKTITLSGFVTVNNQTMGASANSGARGTIGFSQKQTSGRQRSLGTQGPATYSVKLIPGGYHIGVRSTTNCSEQNPLPCQDYLLEGCIVP